MKVLKITSIGFDSWDREVFETEDGLLLCDVNLDRTHKNMRLHTKVGNDFGGEPCWPVPCEVEIIDDRALR